jgi:glucokinase
LDLGGSSVKAVAIAPAGRVLLRVQESFDAERPMHFAETVGRTVERIREELGTAETGLGLSAPGVADVSGRYIAHMPGRLPGLVGLDWGKYLGRPRPVPVLNDALAALQGEVWLGAARGMRDVLLLTLGTGVGGAALVNGRPLRGHTGKAGHLGHLCLNPDGPADICGIPGSLEWAVGNATIGERSDGRYATTHELVECHRRGDANATAIWHRSVKALACAIASYTNVLDPQAVVIGGGIARAGEALFEPLTRWVREMEWDIGASRVQLLPAQLGELAGAYGAAHQVWQNE